jgi:hypothetical protein
MNRVMDDIADITDGKSFHSFKYSIDSTRTPSPDYDEIPEGYTLFNINFDDVLTYKTDNLTRGDFKSRGIATIQDILFL